MSRRTALCADPECGQPAEYYIMPVGKVSFEDYFDTCPSHMASYMGWKTVWGEKVDHYEVHRL